MLVALGVVALMLLFGGDAFAGDRPAWHGLPPAHSHHFRDDCPACHEANPLYPMLTPWSFQPSHCKLPFCSNVRPLHWGKGETPYFPPLPYSPQAIIPPGAPAAVTSTPVPGVRGAP